MRSATVSRRRASCSRASWRGLRSEVSSRRGLSAPPPRCGCTPALEAIVALAGLALVHVLPALGAVLAPRLAALAAHPLLAGALRLVLSFVLLLLPSTAMGATLPLLTSALSACERSFGRVLGQPVRGQHARRRARRRHGRGRARPHAGHPHERPRRRACERHGGARGPRACVETRAASPERARRPSRRRPTDQGRLTHRARAWPWLLAAFVAGFALLALEVVWLRVLLLFLNGTSLAFSMVLAIVLSGIALGSLAAARARVLVASAPAYAGLVSFAAAVLGVLGLRLFPHFAAAFLGGGVQGAGHGRRARSAARPRYFVRVRRPVHVPRRRVARAAPLGCGGGRPAPFVQHGRRGARRFFGRVRLAADGRHGEGALRDAALLWPGRRGLLRSGPPSGADSRRGHGDLPRRPRRVSVRVRPDAVRRGFGRQMALVARRPDRRGARGARRHADVHRTPHARHDASLPALHERLLDVQQRLHWPPLHEAVRVLAPGRAPAGAQRAHHRLRPGKHRQGAHRFQRSRDDRRRRRVAGHPRHGARRLPGPARAAARRPQGPGARRGRPLLPSSHRSALRPHHGRAPSASPRRCGEPIQPRILPAPAPPAHARGRGDLLAAHAAHERGQTPSRSSERFATRSRTARFGTAAAATS